MKMSQFSDSHIIDAIKWVAGLAVPDSCRDIGIGMATFYKWRSSATGWMSC